MDANAILENAAELRGDYDRINTPEDDAKT